MKSISDTVSESVNYLGQSFLLAYYLPALVFMLVHIYLLIPAWSRLSQRQAKPIIKTLMEKIDLTSIINILFGALIIGVILFVLNSVLIKLFEGKPLWVKNCLLKRQTERNLKCNKKLYKNLVSLQKEYRRINHLLWQNKSSEEQRKLKELLDGLALQIENKHKRIENFFSRFHRIFNIRINRLKGRKNAKNIICKVCRISSVAPKLLQTLPLDANRVCPTSFGNAFAIAEEYSYERYGIDSVLFWPRLRQLMREKAPQYSLLLTQQKTVVDLSINFAFIFGLLTVEILIILIFKFIYSTYELFLFLLVVLIVSIIITISFYQASVAAIQILGELIKISFDYYRGLVLEAFKLRMPNNLSEEQALWIKLATFIRRGEVFYFPEEYRITETTNDEVERKNIN